MEPPSESRIDDLNTATPNFGRQIYFGHMDPPSESRIDDSNTATPNLADKPTLANGPRK